jgi:hypothetical protein
LPKKVLGDVDKKLGGHVFQPLRVRRGGRAGGTEHAGAEDLAWLPLLLPRPWWPRPWPRPLGPAMEHVRRRWMEVLGLEIGEVARVMSQTGCANAPFYTTKEVEGMVARIKAGTHC